MLKIKLAPTGKKHERHFRISVMEEHSKLTGRTSEVIGHYHPLKKSLTLDKQLYKKWLDLGATPTSKVRKLYGRLP